MSPEEIDALRAAAAEAAFADTVADQQSRRSIRQPRPPPERAPEPPAPVKAPVKAKRRSPAERLTCKRGHRKDYRAPGGYLQCRVCRKAALERFYERKRLQRSA